MRQLPTASLAKLALFVVGSLVATGTLVAVMGNFDDWGRPTYHAVFTQASQLLEGDDVRVAGVVRGSVSDVEILEGDRARVSFTLDPDLPITTGSRAEIRYLDLVGARYLSIEQGRADAPRLEEGGTLPITQTKPALDLTALYNGFAPLFSALEPAEVNDLTKHLVAVLQGESGTVEGLLRHAGSLSTALADREALVGRVITNLSELMKTVDDRHVELTRLIQGLKVWVGRLADDRVQIGRSVSNLSSMADTLATLLVDARPLLKSDIRELRRLAATLATPDSRKVFDQVLQRLPESYEDQTRTGTYGSWYNYYLCGAKFTITLPPGLDFPGVEQLKAQLQDVSYESTATRCD